MVKKFQSAEGSFVDIKELSYQLEIMIKFFSHRESKVTKMDLLNLKALLSPPSKIVLYRLVLALRNVVVKRGSSWGLRAMV